MTRCAPALLLALALAVPSAWAQDGDSAQEAVETILESGQGVLVPLDGALDPQAPGEAPAEETKPGETAGAPPAGPHGPASGCAIRKSMTRRSAALTARPQP